MDNPLTPNKIQRLIHLAEDRSFNMERRVLLTEEDVKLINSRAASSRSLRCESSSGILDLEHVEGFGDSAMGNISLSKSTAFNPGEMTGRSTGTDEADPHSSGLAPPRTDLSVDDYRRHSLALETFTNKLDKQTAEVNDIMRHSIASNYSFHSKRDLTADEVSLINREAPLPVPQTVITQFSESLSMNNSNLSVGAYFKTRCSEFGKMLAKNDSPDKSMMPSITEVSASTPYEQNLEIKTYTIDDSLDCVPVRQPRIDKIRKQTINLPKPTLGLEKQSQMSSKTESKVQRVEPSVSKVPEKQIGHKVPEKLIGYKVPDKLIGHKAQNPGPSFPAHKSFMTSSKPTDVLLKNLHSSFKLIADDTEGSGENSLSISKIADYLGKQSNVSVSDMLKLQHKKPLTELHMNTQERQDQDVKVTYLKDSKTTETASSAGTVNTVISLEKMKINEIDIPEVVITNQSEIQYLESDVKSSLACSKSPSSKSQSTLSTVKENFNSFKSGDSPLYSCQGEARSKVPSPNVEYKELDKSVDWRDVLQQKHLRQKGLAKEQWAEIVASPVSGFVGVSCAVTIKVTTLTDSWLTAKLQFDDLPNDGKDLNIELPRIPLLLSPAKSEKFTFHMTSNVELNTKLPFTILLKDTSVDGDVPHKGTLEVNFKYPIVQAMSADGLNKVSYPLVQEKACLTKSFVLISDCPVDLQLELSISEGDSLFQIKNVQEIKKSEVNKLLLERQGPEDQTGKSKSKGINKQLCRLTSGNAIRVIIIFNAPKLSDLQLSEPKATFNGVLNVNLIGLNTVLRKIDLVGVVGSSSLQINVPGNKLHVSNVTPLSVSNTGTVTGAWRINYKSNDSNATNEFPFKITSQKFEIQPGATKTLSLSYIGSEDNLFEATLIFEEIATGKQTTLDITGGSDKPKSFPIKTNYNTLSWVRAGRKELSLKNTTDTKLLMRCQIMGDGFAIDLPGVESRGIYCIQFNERECRPLPIVFMPTSCMPYHATMFLAFDKNSDFRRKVKLFGCASGESVRWSGLVTYSDTALVRAVSRAPIDLKLYNKSAMPAFIAARVHFNLQYMSVESTARVNGAHRIVAGRSLHTVSLRVDWARIERRAHESPTTALATVTVLTGAELTRRRILKILKDESNELDISLLPDHLKILTGPFDGEDSSMDNFFSEFEENKASLNELISGLQELTAHIDLPQDFADENTIIISDDTVIDHHTICD